MYTAAVILSVLLALVFLAAGAPKVQLKGPVPDGLIDKGLGSGLVRFVGIAEVAAAVGLGVGIWWQPLGIAAATGTVVVLIGAISFHVKKGEYGDSATRNAAVTPIVLLPVAVATALTLAASL
ncbi:DoxX family protein [Actinacidiphila glaucinigra]|uniref:DoxX family protein n=1 Tax=Actinacidiphila glaucinigra TaxID=235986 RepID=UPI002DD7A757|nr:DoxX family protein [Actinacidiphila glaucinigra]WSD64725.1 DoxX family protein [Actinacidiphila glaucinigra]